ncbi:MAG: sugar ABC transporter permease [Hyphomicrobiales bacterium]|nr:MAG: sugar ABC transporter permease [Hyphomicrobiales bacterium]
MGSPKRHRDNLAALPLVAPFLLVYGALFIWPALQMLALSLTNSQLTLPGEFIGFDNYVKLLGDRKFGTALVNTLYFVGLTVIPSTLLGLALAMVVHRLKGVLQAIVLACFFIPYILPVSTVTFIAWWITDTANGPLGQFVRAPNGDVQLIWRSVPLFLPAVAVLTIWWTVGFNVLIFLAGLRTLPVELYEAARLDGANRRTMFTNITWPLIWPVTALVLTIQLIIQIKVFDQVFLMVSGGRVDATMVLVQYIYTVAFQRNQGGYASTVAIALFVLVVTVALLQYQLLRLRSAK